MDWRNLRHAVARLPLIRVWADRRRFAEFLSPEGFTDHYGIFASFEEARRHLPSSKEFDQPELADEHLARRIHQVFAYDYPVLFWLREALGGGARSVFDIGGSVGVHFFSYGKYLAWPSELSWLVSVKRHEELTPWRHAELTPGSGQLLQHLVGLAVLQQA